MIMLLEAFDVSRLVCDSKPYVMSADASWSPNGAALLAKMSCSLRSKSTRLINCFLVLVRTAILLDTPFTAEPLDLGESMLRKSPEYPRLF